MICILRETMQYLPWPADVGWSWARRRQRRRRYRTGDPESVMLRRVPNIGIWGHSDRAEPKCSNCLLFKQAATAFWLSTAQMT